MFNIGKFLFTLAVAVCAGSTLFCQQTLYDFLERLRSIENMRPSPWLLLVQRDVQTNQAPRLDTGFHELQEVLVLPIEPTDRAEVWKTEGWDGETKWILLSRHDGDQVFVGNGSPTSDEVRKALRRFEYIPLIDRLKAFLALHPDNGLANEANVLHANRLMQLRFRDARLEGKVSRRPPSENPAQARAGGTIPDSESAEEIYADLIVALERFIEVPDWWRCQRFPFWVGLLQLFDVGKSPRMMKTFRRMREDVLREWEKTPSEYTGMLELMWVTFTAALGEDVELPNMEPCPGGIFPHSTLLLEICQHYNLLLMYKEKNDFLDSVLARQPVLVSGLNISEYVEYMEMLWTNKAVAHYHLGNKKGCLEALGHVRMWSGDKWRSNDNFALNNFSDFLSEDELEYDIPDLGDYKDFLPPQINPHYRVIVGDSKWLSDLFPMVRLWTRDEVSFSHFSENDAAQLQNIPITGDKWVILDGDKVLFFGTGLDALKLDLQATLNKHPSRYQQLTQYIYKHPNTIEGRGRRYGVIQSLHGKDYLIEEMVNDALEAGLPLEVDCEIEYSDSIMANVKRHIGRLKQILYRWPNSMYATVGEGRPIYPNIMWSALISWNKIAKIKNLVYNTIKEINFFEDETLWHARLPKTVHSEVMNELLADERMEELRTWIRLTHLGLQEMILYKIDYDKELLELIEGFAKTYGVE